MKSNPLFVRRPVPSFSSESGDAQLNAKQTSPEYGSTKPIVMATKETGGDANTAASTSYIPLLPDLSKFDLTVSEAIKLFAKHNRGCPSDRTLQRYCQNERFECYKLKTTRSGTPVHEWIINSTSLLAFIQTKPEKAAGEVLASPEPGGGAKSAIDAEDTPDVMATPETGGDANQKLVLPGSPEKIPDDMATPEETGDASLGDRNRVALLIENAELTARLDERNGLIGELRDDKQFLRDQVVHERKNDTQLADMHRETLEALKAVAVAGRHTKIEMGDTKELDEPKFTVREGELET